MKVTRLCSYDSAKKMHMIKSKQSHMSKLKRLMSRHSKQAELHPERLGST